MKTLEQIALEVAKQVNKYHIEDEEFFALMDRFAKALVARLARDAEPLCWISEDEYQTLISGSHVKCLNSVYRTVGTSVPLFIHPQPAQSIPDGWQLVPEEPTEKLIDAALQQLGFSSRTIRCAYLDMLAAAPKLGD